MNAVSRFVTKFASIIVCTLHCFDRVIFKGHLAMASAKELERFVDYVLRVRRSHFIKVLAPQFSQALVDHAQRFAAETRPHLSVSHRFLQEGPVGRKPDSRATHGRRAGRHPLHQGNLQFV